MCVCVKVFLEGMVKIPKKSSSDAPGAGSGGGNSKPQPVKIFIGNLNTEQTNERELRDIFGKYGVRNTHTHIHTYKRF
jgi:RNA recognition motif-containing protein